MPLAVADTAQQPAAMFGLDPFQFWIVIAVTLFSGFVKGAVGFAMPMIMMSAFATIDTAVKAMKVGAYDFITKPFKVAEVLCVLEKARERLELREENRQLRHKVEKLQRQRGFASGFPGLSNLYGRFAGL